MARLESLQFRHIRNIRGYSWKDYKSYEFLIQKASHYGVKLYLIEVKVRWHMLKYAAHVQRGSDDSLTKILLHGELYGFVRFFGGSSKSFRNCVKDSLILFNIDPKTWQYVCLDRIKWRSLLREGADFFMTNWYKQRAIARQKRHEGETINAYTYVIDPRNNIAILPASEKPDSTPIKSYVYTQLCNSQATNKRLLSEASKDDRKICFCNNDVDINGKKLIVQCFTCKFNFSFSMCWLFQC